MTRQPNKDRLDNVRHLLQHNYHVIFTESYQPTLQTLTASELASKLLGLKLNTMKADGIIAFILQEAQHCVINDECTKTAESALAACTKGPPKSKEKKKVKPKQDITCKIVTDLDLKNWTVISKEEAKKGKLYGR